MSLEVCSRIYSGAGVFEVGKERSVTVDSRAGILGD